ncbi:MAG: hypothetical protein EB084_12540 [Proteobacteria bacterium]|nr:hypothetical protein [Pseudomonadota bacterium]
MNPLRERADGFARDGRFPPHGSRRLKGNGAQVGSHPFLGRNRMRPQPPERAQSLMIPRLFDHTAKKGRRIGRAGRDKVCDALANAFGKRCSSLAMECRCPVFEGLSQR